MPGWIDALPLLFAQNAAGAPGGNPYAAYWTFVPYVVVIGLWFYLLLIRPQQVQEKKRRSMIDSLKKNDKVITSAGIYGTVVSVDGAEDRVVVRIDDDRGVKVAFTKASILRVLDGAAERDRVKEKDKATETA